MVRDIRRSLVSMLVLTVLLGGVFPVAVWAVAQVAFNDRANGSLIVRDGTVVGSSLLAQGFTSPQYFQPRPSAVDYNASGSGASNLGPNSADLAAAVKERIAAVSAANGIAAAAVPVDLVTASGVGSRPRHLARAARWCRSTASRRRAASTRPSSARSCSIACSRRPSACWARPASTSSS